MKKLLFSAIVLAALMFITFSVSAAEVVETGTCGENITWTYYSDDELVISGTGPIPDFELSDDSSWLVVTPWHKYEDTIKKVTILPGVTEIGNYAFFDINHGFSELSIPDTVTRIGKCAFTICFHLSYVEIPDGVIIIENDAFGGCSRCYFSIPDSVTYISSGTFDDSCVIICNPGSYAEQYAKENNIDYIKGNVIARGEGENYLTWMLTDHGELLVSCYGTMPDFSNASAQPWADHRYSIKTVTFENGVISVGKSAFANCENLTDVTIPESVTSIGNTAFYGCTSLKTITIPYSVTKIGSYVFEDTITIYGYNGSTAEAYANDNSFEFVSIGKLPVLPVDSGTVGENITWTLYEDGELVISGSGVIPDWNVFDDIEPPWFIYREEIKVVTINEGITTIGKESFAGWPSKDSLQYINLTEVSLPNSLSTIKELAFLSCAELREISIPDSVTSIGEGAFCECYKLEKIALPKKLETISSGLFEYCSNLKEITIPDNITTIGDGAFSSCGLTSIDIPDSVKTIDDYAFYYCDDLIKLNLGNGVTTIGDFAFGYCGLTSINIPDSVTSIGTNALANCNALSAITVDADNQYYLSDDDILFDKNKTKLIAYPLGNVRTTYTIPGSVTTVGYSSFRNSANLINIIIPDGVTTIENQAFSSCSALTTVTISEKVTSIGNASFDNCPNLTIRCVKGSEAHFYAMNNNIAFELFTGPIIEETEASEADIYVMGAQLRLDQEDFKTDMRFVTRIRKDFLNANGITEYEGENVKFGSLVLPFENGYMVDGDELSLVTKTTEGWSPAKIPAINKYKEDAEYVYYTVCITDIALYERYYAVRPYVIVSDTKYVYGAQYQTANLHDVCVLAAEDFATRGGVPAAITNIFYKCGHDEIIGKFNDNEVSLPWQF